MLGLVKTHLLAGRTTDAIAVIEDTLLERKRERRRKAAKARRERK